MGKNKTALVSVMPGTDAWTMAVFRSEDAPAGSVVGLVDFALQEQNKALVEALKRIEIAASATVCNTEWVANHARLALAEAGAACPPTDALRMCVDAMKQIDFKNCAGDEKVWHALNMAQAEAERVLRDGGVVGGVKHTPLPWKLEQGKGINAICGADETTITDDDHYFPSAPGIDDMEFILVACNAHYGLVEALKAIQNEAYMSACHRVAYMATKALEAVK